METYHPPKEVEEKEDNSEIPDQEVISCLLYTSDAADE